MAATLADYQKYALELYELFVPVALRISEYKANSVQKKIQQKLFSAHPDWQFVSYKVRTVTYEKDKPYLVILGPVEEGFAISLIDSKTKTPVAGIVVDPAKRLVYFGISGGGAFILAYLENFELGMTNKLRSAPMHDYEEFTCTKSLLPSLEKEKFIAPGAGILETVRNRGTISLDVNSSIAATFVIVNELGGKVTDKDGKPWSLGINSLISARSATDYDYLKNLIDSVERFR